MANSSNSPQGQRNSAALSLAEAVSTYVYLAVTVDRERCADPEAWPNVPPRATTNYYARKILGAILEAGDLPSEAAHAFMLPDDESSLVLGELPSAWDLP